MIKTVKSRMRWVTHAAHVQKIKINTQTLSENLLWLLNQSYYKSLRPYPHSENTL
jgi:hypothetical protein